MEQVDLTQFSADLKFGYGTHEGMVGKNNEDSHHVSVWKAGADKLFLGVVADGVGGQTAGELASRLTVETIENYFASLSAVTHQNILEHLYQAILAANSAVYERAQTDFEVHGMATTIVVVAILNGRLYTSHVGDSRIYLLRQGVLSQITQDHSWVQEAVQAGLITPEQAKTHPNKHVIRRSLGTMPDTDIDQEPVSAGEMGVQQGMAVQVGDLFLLCSDGLTDMVDDEDILSTLTKHGANLEGAVGELIDQANAAGGKDNITVVLMAIPEGATVPAAGEPVPVIPAGVPKRDVVETALEERSGPRIAAVDPAEVWQKEQASKMRLMALGGGVLILVILLVLAYFMGYLG